jgi:hypothetical protein
LSDMAHKSLRRKLGYKHECCVTVELKQHELMLIILWKVIEEIRMRVSFALYSLPCIVA